MATSTGQRVGIWVIAVAMVGGTLAGFIGLILAPNNEAAQQKKTEAAFIKYQEESQKYQEKVDAQSKVLSKKYYPKFKEYADAPSKFSAKSVRKLKTIDIKDGNGKTVDDSSSLAVYYVLWLPDGKIEDQSFSGKSLSQPLSIDELKSASLIEGWKKGLKGMKIGGIREIQVPYELGYGKEDKVNQNTGKVDIPGKTPLKFVVMAIERPEPVAQPEIPQEVLEAYGG